MDWISARVAQWYRAPDYLELQGSWVRFSVQPYILIVFICSFLHSHYTFIMFTTNFREKLKAQSLYMNKILVFIMVYTCSMSLNDGGLFLNQMIVSSYCENQFFISICFSKIIYMYIGLVMKIWLL